MMNEKKLELERLKQDLREFGWREYVRIFGKPKLEDYHEEVTHEELTTERKEKSMPTSPKAKVKKKVSAKASASLAKKAVKFRTYSPKWVPHFLIQFHMGNRWENLQDDVGDDVEFNSVDDALELLSSGNIGDQYQEIHEIGACAIRIVGFGIFVEGFLELEEKYRFQEKRSNS